MRTYWYSPSQVIAINEHESEGDPRCLTAGRVPFVFFVFYYSPLEDVHLLVFLTQGPVSG